MRKRILMTSAAVALLSGLSAARAAEDGTVVICKEALAEPVTAAACATAGLLIHEALAERPFGPNGAVMQVLAAPVKIVDGNIKGAEHESGEGAKLLRGVLGISVKDIERYGIWGGSNSVFRKPFG